LLADLIFKSIIALISKFMIKKGGVINLIIGEKYMAWKIQIDPDSGIIQTVYNGTITVQDVRDQTVEALRLAAGEGSHLFLTDVHNADSGLSTLDIHEVPDQWDELQADQRNKLALVVPEVGKTWRDAQLYETLCVSRGWKVRVFVQRNSAIDWLLGVE